MPQDSTYNAAALPDSVQLKDSLQASLTVPSTNEPSKQDKDSQGFAIEIYLLVVIAIIIVPIIVRNIRSYINRKKLAKILESKEVVFDSMLQHYSPYYKSLSATNKKRFMNRVIVFMEIKEFTYIDIEQEDTMPLLISAAAVQLTFGLEHYEMDYFRNIYVLRNIYKYGLYNVPFEGHVSDDGIYLSWSNFMKDNNDYSDGENVGLHELAHALAYVNFTVEDGKDERFHSKFKEFSEVGRPVFERMQKGEINLLNNYAATNYNEFWAVCVETFFECSEKFRQQLPELYFALCDLLNQDPLTPDKIISPVESS
jgi:Mlc titration factor MtfA (ptsG expression regulator)